MDPIDERNARIVLIDDNQNNWLAALYISTKESNNKMNGHIFNLIIALIKEALTELMKALYINDLTQAPIQILVPSVQFMFT
jgi:ferric iron reductase protein FhuF